MAAAERGEAGELRPGGLRVLGAVGGESHRSGHFNVGIKTSKRFVCGEVGFVWRNSGENTTLSPWN